MSLTAEHAAARGAVLQTHMNEYQGEVDGILRRTGMRPYEYLEQMNVLSDRFLGAHSLLLSDREKELVRDYGVMVCHCPFSNCGKAVPETPALLEMGIVPGFGSDGAAHAGPDLWNEMRVFRSVMNIFWGVPAGNPAVMPAETLFQMMYEGGAGALDEKGRCGNIQAGCHADLISVDLSSPRLYPTGNLLHTLFECAGPGDVRDVICAGRLLMKNGEILTLDEEKILWNARAYREKRS